MPETAHRLDLPPLGGVAWLDVPEPGSDGNGDGRPRTGPLSMQITPLPAPGATFSFHGARLRGRRCTWSASTVCGAELSRPGRGVSSAISDGAIQLIIRSEAGGSVFDTAPTMRGTLRVVDPASALKEQFPTSGHLYTLNVPQAATGMDPSVLAEMTDHTYELTPLQGQLLRSAVNLLLVGANELTTSTSLVGIDRYLAALTGLLLRTAVRKPSSDVAQMESVRARTDAIISAQATDPMLTPASIAAQLNISVRQLYRAFNGSESPAARIRHRRLERAAEMLVARQSQPQVERVAQECGFVSAEYFSRAFRREFGLSPRAYRSAHREPVPTR
jgi:AraC-like DNA-binding protein